LGGGAKYSMAPPTKLLEGPWPPWPPLSRPPWPVYVDPQRHVLWRVHGLQWSNGPHRLMRLRRTWWSNPADATGPIPAPLPQKISLSIQKVSPKSVHSYPQRQPVKTYFSYRQFKITEIHGFMSPGFVIRITLKKHSTCPPRIGCWSGIFHRYPSASYSVHKPIDRQTNHNRRMTFSSSCRQ